jgi:hypothetical protein
MSINILFYGNCQVHAILKTLNLPSNYNIFHIACWKDHITNEYFTDLIKKCDIIITQPVKENYRGREYLSTSYVIQHKKPTCKVIIFIGCYFSMYHFDLTYKQFNNEPLTKPIDYHYNTMIECYQNGKSIEYYINNYVNNLDLKSSEELEKIAENNVTELYKRYTSAKETYESDNIYFIGVHSYIKENYKNKLLFYSMNHPTKVVIQYICEQIINILNIKNTMNYEIDTFGAGCRCILYKCISKVVKFNINDHSPLWSNNTTNDTITKLYYDTYKEIGYA